jgi:hypothetical protein
MRWILWRGLSNEVRLSCRLAMIGELVDGNKSDIKGKSEMQDSSLRLG